MDTKKGYRIIGIILIIISAISLLFGNLIRELWPTTNKILESGVLAFIGALGVIFFAVNQKKIINK